MLAQVFSFLILVFHARRMSSRRQQLAMPAQVIARSLFFMGIGVAALPVFTSPVSAAEWFMTPALRLGYEQNDNFRMTLQPHNTVQGSLVAPRLELGVRSEIWGITGSAEAVRKRYSGEEGLDRDDEKFRLVSNYKTERNNFAINASRVNDAVISGEENDPDLGLVTVQKPRRTESVQPTWSWMMTERAQIQLNYQLSEVSYTDGQSERLYDYQWHAATATWSYMISPRSQFFFTTNYSKYRVRDISLQSQAPPIVVPSFTAVSSVESNTPSYSAGIYHAFSDTMQGTLMLGRRKTSTERNVINCEFNPVLPDTGRPGYECEPDSQQTDDAGTTFSGDFKKKFEKLDITATLSRDIAASGAGTTVEKDLLNIRFERPLTARLMGILATNGNRTRRIAGLTDADADIKQYSIQPALRWHWTQEADLSLIYRYNHLKRDSEDQTAQSRAVYVTLAYTWPRFSVSR